jgi:transcriptional regulator with XRE-family HTH domain
MMAMKKKAPNPIDTHVGACVRMRPMMLGMSQEKLGDALGLTFQQIQKYEKGANRIGASRLQAISRILQAPISFFFEGAPEIAGQLDEMTEAPSPSYMSEFMASRDGLRSRSPSRRSRIQSCAAELSTWSNRSPA